MRKCLLLRNLMNLISSFRETSRFRASQMQKRRGFPFPFTLAM